ncbi:MAG TPA: AI-2E family transporter [Candidatus Limnocylindria bacterium]|nr:AI-2E family transporter [Candidatus Limnocylindria bacterium]
MKISTRERQLLRVVGVLLAAFLALQVFGILWEALGRVADVLVIFGAAWALSYVLAPLVDRIDRRTRLDRFGAVIVVYAAIFVLLAAAGAFAVPRLADQLRALAARGPELAAGADQTAKELQATLDRLGIPVNIVPLYEALPGRLAGLAATYASDALGVVSATATIVFDLLLVLIIAFLMLLDGDALWNRFTGMLSGELRSEFELLRMSTDRSFGGFIRGSLILGLIYGIATLLILVGFGVPFSGVLAVFSGLFVMIPFFGPILALVPVLVIAFLGAPDSIVPVAILSLLLQQVMLNVVSPRIMSKSIGIHPIFVFFALLIGSKIAGFWGVLLGVPVAGVINTFIRYAVEVNSGRRQRTEAAALMEDAPIEAAQ